MKLNTFFPSKFKVLSLVLLLGPEPSMTPWILLLLLAVPSMLPLSPLLCPSLYLPVSPLLLPSRLSLSTLSLVLSEISAC